MNRPLRVILTGGGTGGHVYPALAVAAAAEGDEPAEFLFVGTNSGLERGIVEAHGMPFVAIAAGSVRGRSPLGAASGLWQTLRGIRQAQAQLRRFQPQAVLATGGFVGVPVVLAARLAGVPAVVYLPDLRPGWAVQLLSRVATAVAVSFEEVVPHVRARRVVVTGYPVRPDLFRWDRTSARRRLGLPSDEPAIVVLGGSRGARSVNDAVAAGLDQLVARARVIHSAGAQNVAELEARRQQLAPDARARYIVRPYLSDELAPALAAATLVVARAGASTLGEFPAVGVPAVLVPYPYAGAHQHRNARFLADRGAAVVVDDADARRGELVRRVLALLEDADRLAAMAAASRSLARPNAARRLLELVGALATAAPRPSLERRSA